MKLLSCCTCALIFSNGTPKQTRKSKPGKGEGLRCYPERNGGRLTRRTLEEANSCSEFEVLSGSDRGRVASSMLRKASSQRKKKK
jgi:hypothetical protein